MTMWGCGDCRGWHDTAAVSCVSVWFMIKGMGRGWCLLDVLCRRVLRWQQAPAPLIRLDVAARVCLVRCACTRVPFVGNGLRLWLCVHGARHNNHPAVCLLPCAQKPPPTTHLFMPTTTTTIHTITIITTHHVLAVLRRGPVV